MSNRLSRLLQLVTNQTVTASVGQRLRQLRQRSKRRLFIEQLEDRRLMAIIDLSNLGSAGTTIFGADSGDDSGVSVNSAGDINGDGYDDLVIGAHHADAVEKSSAGDSYVIFGKADWSLTPTIDLASLGADGITILGSDAGDYSGYSVSGAGDVNGDGFDDLVIGAHGAGGVENLKFRAGESYVIFGKADWSATPTLDLANLAAAGFTIVGADTGDESGVSVSSAGDVNGDGFGDLVIGAFHAFASGNLKNDAGESYVIFGKADWIATPTIDLGTLGTAGITIFGADAVDFSGRSVSSAGDVNGDGFDDLVIGASLADASENRKSGAGDTYLIFGRADWSEIPMLHLTNLDNHGVTFFGATYGDRSGSSVSGAGDVNGDGFDDLVIGAYGADALGNLKSAAGESYVIFGKADWTLTPTIDLANLGITGITIYGADTADISGCKVSGAGDVNADGFDDLLIGALNADGRDNLIFGAGESYVIFGKSNWNASPTIDLSNLGADGITIFGADMRGYSGRSVSDAGDVNGDGFDDLLIAARIATAPDPKLNAGKSYVIFGGNSFTNSVVPLGGVVGDLLYGSADANVINGAGGNDTLVGNGGADILIGGQGDDELVVSDLVFKRLVGGTGVDRLRLDGVGLSLNLTTIRDNRIVGIETIDITGSGNNTLTLNQREVLNISDESNTLIVRRKAGDIVNIGSGWTQLANETISSSPFLVYAQGQARLKVQAVGVTSVANRQLFYNHSTSTVFGNGSGNPIHSIDSTKTALLPNQSTSIANYTNYNRGLNGIVVDVVNVVGMISVADLQFATWDGINVAGFEATTAAPTVSVIPGGGVAGSTRVKIEFDDNAIQNTWLRVTVLGNANTGLAANDVFYFGNAIGDMNNGNVGNPTTVRTNATDTSIVRQNQSIGANSVGVTSIHDLNKDGRVNATDTSIVRQNQSASIIRFFDALASFLAADAESAIDSIMADSSWLDGLDPFSTKRRRA